MTSPTLTRRRFLHTLTFATAALPLIGRAETGPKSWPIGCFDRPWTKWGYDAALDGMKAAGYGLTGLVMNTKVEPLTTAAATPEYLENLKKRIAARNLAVNMTVLRPRTNLPLPQALADTRRQLDNAHFMGVQFALTSGVSKPEEYALYFKLMADAAAYAQERGIKLVIKPHGGGSGSSEEMLHCIKEVNHSNFKIWYDAGNIIYYTGKDPLKELEPIAEHVTGLCAKDCLAEKGEVMIQFGTGKVDFPAVFRRLKAAGFNGPIMVESCKIGETPEETTANAKANRLYLEKVLAEV